MDDEDDAPSPLPSSPSPSPSLSPSLPPDPVTVVHPSSTPPPHAHLSGSVTVAATGPITHHQTLTLALPIQNPPGSGNSGGGGRDDCWSEGATSALIDAWGERFVELSRGNLKQKHWQEVADVVSSRDDYSKPHKTDVQCKNRIDTLKKKYKLEKSKIVAGGLSASSSWPFFHRLDVLLGPSIKPSSSSAAGVVAKQPPPAAVAAAARSQFPQKQRTNVQAKRKASSPAASASSTSDSFPPAPPPPPPPPASANGRRKGLPVTGLKELTRAILKFGEVYQRIESSKLQQAMEMERRRMGFAQDLEMQRIQFFMKTQMELSQLKRRRTSTEAGAKAGAGAGGGTGGGSSNHHHSRRPHHQIPGNNHDYASDKRAVLPLSFPSKRSGGTALGAT